jgi:hypothetical protein
MPKPMDDQALRELLDLGFDFLCSRKVAEFVDPEAILRAVDATHDEGRIAHLVRRYVAPARERLLERARGSDVLLGAWLPDDAKAKVADLLGQPMPIPQSFIDEAVASEGVRDQIRETLRDTLSNFVTKVTSGGAQVGSGGGGKLIGGAIGLGARAFGAAGRSLLGSLGEEVQKQMQDRVRDFVDGAVGGVQERIAKRLADPKTAEEVGRVRKKAFLRFLERPESEVARSLATVPHAAIEALIPSVVMHNVKRDALRVAVRAEVAAVLADVGEQTVGALLDEVSARELARTALHEVGLPILRDMCKTTAFDAWWKARDES